MAVETLVLLVDSDPASARLARLELQAAGCRVLTAETAKAASEFVDKVYPDVLVIASRLPDSTGLQVMQRLQEQAGLPVILLAEHRSDAERVRALKLGADDCLTKPFDPQELVARVLAVLRRSRRPTPTSPSTVSVAGMVLDFRNRSVQVDGQIARLNRAEWRLLERLVAKAGEVVESADLLSDTFGDAARDDAQRLRVAMSRLRTKLGSAGFAIHTVRGRGYLFDRRRGRRHSEAKPINGANGATEHTRTTAPRKRVG